MERYIKALRQSILAAGFEYDLPPKLEGYLRGPGFVDVQVVVKKLPVGRWPRHLAKKVRLKRLFLFLFRGCIT